MNDQVASVSREIVRLLGVVLGDGLGGVVAAGVVGSGAGVSDGVDVGLGVTIGSDVTVGSGVGATVNVTESL